MHKILKEGWIQVLRAELESKVMRFLDEIIKNYPEPLSVPEKAYKDIVDSVIEILIEDWLDEYGNIEIDDDDLKYLILERLEAFLL